MAEETGAPPQAGFQATVSAMGTPAPQTQQTQLPSFAELVPQDLKEKDWVGRFAKAENPIESFFKSYDSAQTMLGSRIEIPKADAPPEVVKAFHKALGVPDTPTGYEYKAPDLSKESEQVQKSWLNASQDTKLLDAAKQVALNVGMTPAQFAAMASVLDTHNLEGLKAQLAAEAQTQEQADKELRAQFEGYYKDKASVYEKTAKEVAAKVVPPEVAKMGPEVALIHALNYIHENLYRNDGVSTQATNAGTTAMTVQALQAKIDKERNDPAWENKLDPRHEAHHKYVMGLYKELSDLKKELKGG